MKILQPRRFEPEERLLAVDPPLAERVDDAWNRRPRYYTGRALTADVLELQDQHHRQHLNIYGRQLSDGIVRGLEAEAAFVAPEPSAGEEDQPPPTPRDGWWLEIGPGLGVMGSGLDLTLRQRRRILIAEIPVLDDPESLPEGVGVVLLEPVVAETLADFDEDDPCEWDPEQHPFEDRQWVEGARVTWMPWPEEYVALPADDAHFRNRLAYRLFERERSAPRERPPWEARGVALALVRLNADGSVAFLDRHAVTRQGGAPLSVLPTLESNGWPFLWQARMQQMLQHLYDLQDTGADLTPAVNHFRFLPPVGSLPKELVDLDNLTTEFFPGQYFIEAAPIPLSQLDVAVEGAASLQAYDLYEADRVKLLVPVPEAVYEPELLQREQVDPVFLSTLRSLVSRLQQFRTNRNALRDMAPVVIGSIELEGIPEYPSPDPDSVADEVAQLPFVIPDPLSNLDVDFGQEARDLLIELHDWFDGSPTIFTEQIAELEDNPGTDFMGMEEFIQDLQSDIEQTNDRLETIFGEVQGDLYRLRQMLLGHEKASRLATSPAMKDVTTGRLDTPSSLEISRFFDIARPAAVAAAAPIVAAAPEPEPEPSGSGDSGEGGEFMITNAFLMAGTERFFTHDDALVNMTGSTPRGGSSGGGRSQPDFGGGLTATDLGGAMFLDRGTPQPGVSDILIGGGRVPDGVADILLDSGQLTLEANYDLFDNNIERRLYERPMFYRTITIDERVYTPPSVEAKNEALSRKVSVFESLQRVPVSIADIQVSLRTGAVGIFSDADFTSVRDAQAAPVQAVLDARARRGVDFVALNAAAPLDAEVEGLSATEVTALNTVLEEATRRRQIRLDSADLVTFTKLGLFDPDPPDGDEAAYFSAGIIALEDAIAAIRQVEQRLALYRLGIKQSRATLGQLQKNLLRWQKQLAEMDDLLAEMRHDVTVARALFEEEKQRVQGINDRRRKILATQVPFVTFLRPRLGSAMIDQPSTRLYGEFVDPVPACLAEDYEATDELEEMLDLFREVPLAWLPSVKPVLRQLDRPEFLYDVLSYARNRAQVWLDTPTYRVATPRVEGADKNRHYGSAVSTMLQAYRTTRSGWYQRRAQIQVQQLQNLHWQQAQDQAEQDLSLADLIEAGRGRSAMARAALVEMERLEDVAVCLYNRCGDVLPAVRLQWADAISVFDRPFDLRDLQNLPSWAEVDFELRRELQSMVAWLFSRIESGEQEALRLMNDLVRVCILLASHAPVSSIISGHVPRPTVGKTGDVIDLNLDKGRIRIGMQVAVYSGSRMAVQGVVEDLSSAAVRVKVTQSAQRNGQFNLEQGARAQFYAAPSIGYAVR